MQIVSFINNKGGVLKTSLVTNLAGVLGTQNKRVLILDTDPQGSSIGRFGRNADVEKHNLTDFITNKSSLQEIIKWVYKQTIAIITSDFSLTTLDLQFSAEKIPPQRLNKKLQSIIEYANQEFDFLLIDSAPTFSRVTYEIIKISDSIIVPTSLEQDSFKGVTTVINVLKNLNMLSKLSWIIPTLVKGRTNLHKNLLNQWLKPLAHTQKIRITQNVIQDSIRVATSAALEKLPITLTKSKHKAKMIYFELSKELGLSLKTKI